MMEFLRRLFGKKQHEPQFSEEEFMRHSEAKQAGLERVLGPMHDMVGHAIIPFHVGGAVDMYYFPHAINGTAFATMELIDPGGGGPKPGRIGTYELVAFTRHKIDLDSDGPFKQVQHRICRIFTMIGHYSPEAELSPGETCELPAPEGREAPCILFDEWSKPGVPFEIDGQRHGLLLCIEVFRQEVEYAREHGSDELLARLKEKSHYPYSDLDREPVV